MRIGLLEVGRHQHVHTWGSFPRLQCGGLRSFQESIRSCMFPRHEYGRERRATIVVACWESELDRAAVA